MSATRQIFRGVYLSDIHRTSEWTEWQNTDKPDDGGGDREMSYYACALNAEPTAAECRVVGSSVVFSRETQFLAPDRLYRGCTTNGLICRNHDQPIWTKCQDYEVRFFCPKYNFENKFGEFWLIIVVSALSVTVPLGVVVFFQCVINIRTKRQQTSLRGMRSPSLRTNQSEAAINPEMNQAPPSYESLYGHMVIPPVVAPNNVEQGNTNGASLSGNVASSVVMTPNSVSQGSDNIAFQTDNQISTSINNEQIENSPIAVTDASGNMYHNNLHRQLQMQSVNPGSIRRNTVLTLTPETVNLTPQIPVLQRQRSNSQIETPPPTYQDVVNWSLLLSGK